MAAIESLTCLKHSASRKGPTIDLLLPEQTRHATYSGATPHNGGSQSCSLSQGPSLAGLLDHRTMNTELFLLGVSAAQQFYLVSSGPDLSRCIFRNSGSWEASRSWNQRVTIRNGTVTSAGLLPLSPPSPS